MVSETDSEHLRTIGGTEIQGIWCVSFTEEFLLECKDLNDGLLHGFMHFLQGICFLPAFFTATVCKVCDVESGSVLRICATKYVAVCVEGEEGRHFSANRGKV